MLLCKLVFMESLSANKWFYLLWKHKPTETPLRCHINKLNHHLWNDNTFFSLNWKKNLKATTRRKWWVGFFPKAFLCYSKNHQSGWIVNWTADFPCVCRRAQQSCVLSFPSQFCNSKKILFCFVRSVIAVPPTSNKVKINVKLTLIFKVSYSIPCFSVCEEIRIISLRISSQLPCQGIC